MAELIVQGGLPKTQATFVAPGRPGSRSVGRSAPLAVTFSAPFGLRRTTRSGGSGTGPGDECLGCEATPASGADRSKLLTVSCRRLA